MRIHADYLSKSRHGIWYDRRAVPEAIRRLHPELPKELKRSTRTADTRVACGIARRLHLDHLRRLDDTTAMNLEAAIARETGRFAAEQAARLASKPEDVSPASTAAASMSVSPLLSEDLLGHRPRHWCPRWATT